MWFEVENEHSRVFKGQLTINDQTVDIEVWFMEHDLTSIETLNHGGELWGHSEFYPDQVILHIDEELERDSIFYGKYENFFTKNSALKFYQILKSFRLIQMRLTISITNW
jgi:hypothetical protein